MTPEEFLNIRDAECSIVDAAIERMEKARAEANNSEPPKDRLRRAVADDIRPGLIVWHDDGDDGWFWHIVDEPRHYGDDFKAYVADDGCRYGLRGAWVMKS